MKCDRCQRETATVRINQSINGVSETLHLCRSCALALENEYAKNSWAKLFPDSFFGSWLGHTGGIPSFGAPVEKPASVSCPGCGCKFDDFRRTGLLGCPECYQAFREHLDQIFRRVQGDTVHTGRVAGELPRASQEVNEATSQETEPEPAVTEYEMEETSTIRELQRQQQQAVNVENYEEAARLRDRIRELEAALSSEKEEQS